MPRPYMAPDDRAKMSGTMGNTSMAPPGQLEPNKPDYDEEAPPSAAENESFNAPISALGGKEFEPGEEVMLKVVSVDKKNGMVTLSYAPDEHADNHPGMGEMGGMDDHPALRDMDDKLPE